MSTQKAQVNNKRDQLLLAIEQKLQTKVIAYLTGDRPNLQAQISADVVPKFRRHLEAFGEVPSISLFFIREVGIRMFLGDWSISSGNTVPNSPLLFPSVRIARAQ
jgi:hypothetical protein